MTTTLTFAGNDLPRTILAYVVSCDLHRPLRRRISRVVIEVYHP